MVFNSKEEIPFDRYQRYETVARLIMKYKEYYGQSTVRIIEIGANEHKDLRFFLPKDDILFTDSELSDEMKTNLDFQQADGTSLPYSDEEFDFAVAVDVLEHIPLEKREAFLTEAFRISKAGAILSFPDGTHNVCKAEAELYDYYHGFTKEEYRWLDEHRKYGLPVFSEVEKVLVKHAISYSTFTHGSLDLWKKIWYCHFNTAFMSELLPQRIKIDSFYNKNLYLEDVSNSNYRRFLVIYRNSAKKLEEACDSLWERSADQGKLYTFNELTDELIRSFSLNLWREHANGHLDDELQLKRLKQAENQVSELQKDLSEKQNELINERSLSRKLNTKLEETNNQLAYANYAYSVISNAFFWKITSLARKICDMVKKILHRFGPTMLLCKGLRSLHQNGIRYTWQKVKKKLVFKVTTVEAMRMSFCTATQLDEQRSEKLPNNIKISVVVPAYNTPKKFLREMIHSACDQTYTNWELCIADGSDDAHGYVRSFCENLAKKDHRIKYQKLKENQGISGNTNACIQMSTGEYIALLDHDDVLHPSALYEVVREICTKQCDVVFTDEAVFNFAQPGSVYLRYKPDFGPDSLRSLNYICHFLVFSRALFDKIGGFRSEYDGSQDHDFVLRASEATRKINHIPKILYFWRSHPGSVAGDISAKIYAVDAGKRAVSDHIKRMGMSAEVLSSSVCPTLYRIKYRIEGLPKVSIIIPNKDEIETLKKCVESILYKSTYVNIEILIVENNSIMPETFSYYEELEKLENVRILHWDKDFNYPAINNFAAANASGEYYLLLNNDTEVISPAWIQEMLMYAQRKDVGVVGAKLYYPNDTVQHGGIAVGIQNYAGRSFVGFDRQSGGYDNRLFSVQNLSAVTAACIMVRKDAWSKVSGLDESFAVAVNDIDFCLRIRKAGYNIVWTPYAELYHYESKTRGYDDSSSPEKKKRYDGELALFRERWKSILEQGDPYYNPNLTHTKEDFSIGE